MFIWVFLVLIFGSFFNEGFSKSQEILQGPTYNNISLSNFSVIHNYPGLKYDLKQHWSKSFSKNNSAGSVLFSYNNKGFLVLAELLDSDPFSLVTKDNDQTWVKGDLFEILIQEQGVESYWEFHFTPNNFSLQMLLPNKATIRGIYRGDAFEHLFKTQTGVRFETKKHPQGWNLKAYLPWKLFGKSQTSSHWLYVFARNDMGRHRKNSEISASGNFTKIYFHDQKYWHQGFIQNKLLVISQNQKQVP